MSCKAKFTPNVLNPNARTGRWASNDTKVNQYQPNNGMLGSRIQEWGGGGVNLNVSDV